MALGVGETLGEELLAEPGAFLTAGEEVEHCRADRRRPLVEQVALGDA